MSSKPGLDRNLDPLSVFLIVMVIVAVIISIVVLQSSPTIVDSTSNETVTEQTSDSSMSTHNQAIQSSVTSLTCTKFESSDTDAEYSSFALNNLDQNTVTKISSIAGSQYSSEMQKTTDTETQIILTQGNNSGSTDTIIINRTDASFTRSEVSRIIEPPEYETSSGTCV